MALPAIPLAPRRSVARALKPESPEISLQAMSLSDGVDGTRSLGTKGFQTRQLSAQGGLVRGDLSRDTAGRSRRKCKKEAVPGEPPHSNCGPTLPSFVYARLVIGLSLRIDPFYRLTHRFPIFTDEQVQSL